MIGWKEQLSTIKKQLKAGVGTPSKKQVLPSSISIIRQNLVKNQDKLKEVPLFFDDIFHMTHIDNLKNILKNGLLSHNNPYKKIDISNQSVNQNRNKIEPIYKNNLHNYVPFYFNCRNAMLYKAQKEFDKNIIILVFEKDIMLTDNSIFTNKNAATNDVNFTNDIQDLLNNDFINWDDVNATSWHNYGNPNKDLEQTMMAEILVLHKVDISKIKNICCQTNHVKYCIKNNFAVNDIEVNTCRTAEIFF